MCVHAQPVLRCRMQESCVAMLLSRKLNKVEEAEHRFSGQTSRLACVPLFTPIDSEFDRHSKTGLRGTHAIFSQKSIFSAMGCRELKNSYVKLGV
eukprot:COSAG05_NODE_714_length_7813_cov_41.624060_3_plen_95_part_00